MKTLAEEIITIIQSEANNNPAPVTGIVKKVIDEDHIDINLNGDVLKYVPCNKGCTVGDAGIVVFLDGELSNPYFFSNLGGFYTRDEIDEIVEEIISGDIDLTKYVSKVELSTILSSYVTSTYVETHYAVIDHLHPNYVDRSELSDLDLDLTTLELVPYNENPNGVMCFTKSSEKGVDWDKINNKPSTYPPSAHTHDDRYYTETETNNLLNSKQNTLISGTNIKTINNQTLLGSGNITIQGGGGGSVIGTGSFSINNNGHLIVELPDAVDNPYFIDNNGHLIYDTSNTHNGG